MQTTISTTTSSDPPRIRELWKQEKLWSDLLEKLESEAER